MHPAFQLAGSLLILVPFVLVQARRMTPSTVPYIVLNLVGSTMLAIDATVGRQWGFLLLEGVWALVSAGALVRTLRTTGAASDEATA